MTCDRVAEEWQSYSTIECLTHIYLEDSYVLDVFRDATKVVFDVEFVLMENHPVYRAPQPGEQYCYQRGKIIFSGVQIVKVFERIRNSFTDANDEKDIGNIDSFVWRDDEYCLSGDWGKLDVISSPPTVICPNMG
jgi:hypothetical protein